jgi:hypothetical protein
MKDETTGAERPMASFFVADIDTKSHGVSAEASPRNAVTVSPTPSVSQL